MIRIMSAAIAVIAVGAVGAIALSGTPAGAASGPEPAELLDDAVSAIKAKNYNDAISLLSDALEQDGQNADALNFMGYSYRKLGKYDRAVSFYKQALEVDPDHRGANEYLGEAYLEVRQPGKAKRRLDKLAKLCGPGCEEYRDLKKSFDAYRAHSSAQQSRIAQ